MKIRTKSTLVIIGVLLIGFFIGFLTHFLIIRNRILDFKDVSKRNEINQLLIERLDLSEDQVEIVNPILDKYEMKFRQFGINARKEMAVIIDSLRSDLKPYLTKEQISQLNTRYKRFQNLLEKKSD